MERDRKTATGLEARYRHPDPVTDAALDWLLALQDLDADPALKVEYEAWRVRDPRHGEAFDRLTAIWGMKALSEASGGLVAADAEVQPRVSMVTLPHVVTHAPGFVWWRPLALAAGLLLAIGLVQVPNIILRLKADYISETGAQTSITLPDGSRMLLDGGSAVALDFAEGRRGVRLLAGEVFFDVVSDPSRPFRVSATYSKVEVRGTAFAVRSEPSENIVVLERGSVEVRGPVETGSRVMLEPGRMVTASNAGLSAPRAAEPAALLAWREGRYLFENQPLSRVVATFRRHYRGTIILVGNRLGQVEVSGNYRLDDPVGALRSLAEIAGGTATVLPGGFILVR